MRGKKSILYSLLVIVCVGALVGAGVMATFSDTETSGGNAFAAGTLDLKVNGADDPGVPVTFNLNGCKPGDSGSVNINCNNAGTINGGLLMQLLNVANAPGSTPEPEPTPDNGELGGVVVLTIKNSVGNVLATGTINSLAGSMVSLCGLAAGATETLSVDYSIPLSAGNEIQGDIVTFDILFSLNQSAIVNGGFETGDTTGWVVEEAKDFVGVVSGDTIGSLNVTPKEGGYMVRLGEPNGSQPQGDNTISQTFVAMGPQLHFAYNLCSKDYYPYDKFEYKVTVETMSGTVIDSYTTTAPLGNPGGNVWTTGWKDVNLNVTGYTGQQLKVKITAAGTLDTINPTWAYVDELIN